MDNANKIKQDFTHKEVALFLGKELKSSDNNKTVTYNLESEYAKTKKNKQPFVWLLLFLCFIIVGAGTLITVKLLKNSNNKITINIDSFDDLNLKALLSSTNRIKNSKNTAIKKKKMLEDSYKNELVRAKQKQENDLYTLKTMEPVISKKSAQERKEMINLSYTETINRLKSEYETQIQAAQEDIEFLENQESEYDTSKLSQALEEEETIDSTKQLHDLEMNLTSERYEKEIERLQEEIVYIQNKAAQEQKDAVEEVRSIYQAKIDLLDPKAREQNSTQDKIIWDAGIKNETPISSIWETVDSLNFDSTSYSSVSKNPEQEFTKALSEAQENLSELKIIGSRFKPIPMENSIKDYVPAIIKQSYNVANTLAKSHSDMQQQLDRTQSDLSIKNNFIENLLFQDDFDGLILSYQDGIITAYIRSDKLNFLDNESAPAQIPINAKTAVDITVYKQAETFIVEIPEPTQEGNKKSLHSYEPSIGDKFVFVTEK